MGTVLLCVGECLSPALTPGETIEVTPVPAPELRPGDLAVYCARRVYACHRVLYRRRRDGIWWFFLKPDNTRVADGWIPLYRIHGKVTRVGKGSAPRISPWRLWRLRGHHALWAARIGLARRLGRVRP